MLGQPKEEYLTSLVGLREYFYCDVSSSMGLSIGLRTKGWVCHGLQVFEFLHRFRGCLL